MWLGGVWAWSVHVLVEGSVCVDIGRDVIDRVGCVGESCVIFGGLCRCGMAWVAGLGGLGWHCSALCGMVQSTGYRNRVRVRGVGSRVSVQDTVASFGSSGPNNNIRKAG